MPSNVQRDAERAEPEDRDVRAPAIVQENQKPVDLGLLRATTPAEMVRAAEAIATPLAQIIESRKLFTEMGKKRHVHVEAWATMLAMLGIVPREKWAKRIECEVENPDTGNLERSVHFEVYTELVRAADGQVIGGASAECGGPDEPDWHFRPRYRWEGGQRIEDGHDRVPPNARRSMAGTRSVGKAGRTSFAWIVVLAGYDATPREEMVGVFDTSKRGGGTQQRKGGPRRMQAKFDSDYPCTVCGKPPQQGEWIAYEKKPTYTLADHWECYERTHAAGGVIEDPPQTTPKPATDQPRSRPSGVRRETTKATGKCRICSAPIKPGMDVAAYEHDGATIMAHFGCYERKTNQAIADRATHGERKQKRAEQPIEDAQTEPAEDAHEQRDEGTGPYEDDDLPY